MTWLDGPTRHAFLIAAAVLLSSAGAMLAHLPTLAVLLLPAVAGFLVAVALPRRTPARATPPDDAARLRADELELRLAESQRAASQLRHDLRGILSPALLTADRLAMSQDPVARRAGEAMISTVERAEARLAPPASS